VPTRSSHHESGQRGQGAARLCPPYALPSRIRTGEAGCGPEADIIYDNSVAEQPDDERPMRIRFALLTIFALMSAIWIGYWVVRLLPTQCRDMEISMRCTYDQGAYRAPACVRGPWHELQCHAPSLHFRLHGGTPVIEYFVTWSVLALGPSVAILVLMGCPWWIVTLTRRRSAKIGDDL
jgi:hypothetical protein